MSLVLVGESLIRTIIVVPVVLLCVCCVFAVGSLVTEEMTVEEVYTSGRSNKYIIGITAPDSWQTDTPLNIAVRVTLAEKTAEPVEVHAYVDRSQWVLRGDDVEFFSTSPRSSIILAEEGDSWETTIQWSIRLPRGKSVTVTLALSLWLGEFPANATDPLIAPPRELCGFLNITEGGLSTPITIGLSRPWLSAAEGIVFLGVAAISALWIALAFRFRSTIFSVAHVISGFFDKHSFLTKVSCSVIIVALWTSLFPVLFTLSAVFWDALLVAILLSGGFVVVAIILSVGLLDFILQDWSLVQTGLGFIIALFAVLIVYWVIQESMHAL